MHTDASSGWANDELTLVLIGIVLALTLIAGGIRWLRLESLRRAARMTFSHGGALQEGPDGPAPFGPGNTALATEDTVVPHWVDGSDSHQWLDRGEYATYGAMSAAAIVWGWASIDPDIVAAADFASEAGIRNGFDFAQYIHAHMDGLREAAKEGFLSRLQGYIGERQVADILMAQGHTVELAATANQPIWDLLMDGHAVNVKTVAETASVLDVAADHPDVTYIVPADAHGETAHNVLRLEGFSHDTAKEAVHESIAAAHGDTALQWIMHNVPWVTLGFSALRQYHAVEKGKPIGVAIHHGLADTVGRGGGAILGAKAGAAIGTLVGPVGTLVGAVIAAKLGGKLAKQYKERGLRRALDALKDALHVYGAKFSDRLQEIRDYLYAPLRTKEQSVCAVERHVQGLKRSWRWWLWPDFRTVLLDEAVQVGHEAVRRERAAVASVDAVIQRATETGRYEEIGLMLANSPVIRDLLGCTDAMLEPVRRAREAVLTERRYLHPELTDQLR